MNECPNDIQIQHTSLLATMQADIANLKNQIANINSIDSSISKSLERITTVLEYNSKEDFKRDAVMEKLSDVIQKQGVAIVKVSDNLEALNNEIKGTNTKVDKLKDDVYDKFDALEKGYKVSEEKSKIDIRDIWQKFFSKYTIPAAFSVAIVLILLKVLGKI